MKVLIIGKTSYVGTSVKKYIDEHHHGFQIDLISSRNNDWKEFNFSGYDTVYNVSGLCHADSKHGMADMYYAINADLPIAIAKKARDEGVPQFIQMSSMIVFGKMSHIGIKKVISATTIPKPENVYGQSKLKAEIELQKLATDDFKVVIMRPPLIYGENAKDNFPRLVRFAKSYPLFPNIYNTQSMIYIDNFCELIYLIVKSRSRGVFMPQDREYITTSRLVKDIANISGNKLHLTRLFNTMIKLLACKVYFFNKVFGNITYEKSVSIYFEGVYWVVDYSTALERIVTNDKSSF